MGHLSETDLIREHAGKITASGVLGRSKINLDLFNYLVDRSIDGTIPKELEIAIDVFAKNADFDVGHDSIVRVYIHKLRQRIDDFYRNHGAGEPGRIVIPKGQYRLAVAPALESGNAAQDAMPVADEIKTVAGTRRGYWLAVVLVLSLFMNVYLYTEFPADTSPASQVVKQVSHHPLWAGIFADDLPVTLVLGDYFIFAELDEKSDISRLVREFSINSRQDLENLLQRDPELKLQYLDVDLNYLPVASAYALKDILPVISSTHKPVDIVLMSEFNVAQVKTGHVVYVGYISGMDKLIDFVFKTSGLAIANTYDGLTNLASGVTYYSEAGILPDNSTNYRDYGLLSTFPGPAGNRIIIIAGTRDEGLMQTAHAVTTPAHLQVIDQALPEINDTQVPAFEVLYEVIGMDRTNLDSMLIYSSRLDYRTIWGGELPVP